LEKLKSKSVLRISIYWGSENIHIIVQSAKYETYERLNDNLSMQDPDVQTSKQNSPWHRGLPAEDCGFLSLILDSIKKALMRFTIS